MTKLGEPAALGAGAMSLFLRALDTIENEFGEGAAGGAGPVGGPLGGPFSLKALAAALPPSEWLPPIPRPPLRTHHWKFSDFRICVGTDVEVYNASDDHPAVLHELPASPPLLFSASRHLMLVLFSL